MVRCPRPAVTSKRAEILHIRDGERARASQHNDSHAKRRGARVRAEIQTRAVMMKKMENRPRGVLLISNLTACLQIISYILVSTGEKDA